MPMTACPHCGMDVIWDEQHKMATPDGDAWVCREPKMEELMGNDKNLGGVLSTACDSCSRHPCVCPLFTELWAMDDETKASIEHDRDVYGVGYGIKVDGKIKRIPPTDVITMMMPVGKMPDPKDMTPQMKELVARLRRLQESTGSPYGSKIIIEDVEPRPIPMFLFCPCCKLQHIDVGEFATRSHKSHTCQGCGLTWKQAEVPTVGVKFLPGTQNDAK